MSVVLRVVKVGGSLFSLPDLPERLKRWLAQQPASANVLLAGGGPLADAVRQWDQRFQLGEYAAHWLCVDLLDTTAQLLHALLPESQLCRNSVSVFEQVTHDLPVIVFAPAIWLREEEAQQAASRLPCSWDVTSDSIAARLAEMLNADELVLLKSAPPPRVELAELSGNYVDRHFSQIANRLARVRFVDLALGDQ